LGSWKAKIVSALLAAVLIAPAAVAAEKQVYKMATQNADSPSYLVMYSFAKLANRYVPHIQVEVEASGVSTDHALDAGRGETDFFLSAPAAHFFMSRGEAIYERETEAADLSKNIRGILNFPAGVYHITTLSDSGINSLQDIKGNKVYLGPDKTAAKVIAVDIIEGLSGLKAGVDFEMVSMDWRDGAQALKNREIDIYVNPTNVPSPIIRELAMTSGVRFFGLTDESYKTQPIIRQMKLPGRTLETIDTKIYGNNVANSDPIQSIGSWVGIGTHKDVPAEAVYEMTKAFWEHLEDVHAFAPWLNAVQLETTLTEMNIPLHPGAQKYYEEMGMVIPGDLKAQ
jgi:TRAP transporter TAXI family solute receptor